MKTLKINNHVKDLTDICELPPLASVKITKDEGPPVYLSEGPTAGDAADKPPQTLHRCIRLQTHPYEHLFAWTPRFYDGHACQTTICVELS